MNKKKVLYLIPSLNTGGAEKVVIDLANNLVDFDVSILSLRDDIPLSIALKAGSSITIYTCGLKRTKFPYISISTFFQFIKYLRIVKPDILHSHLWGINCFYLLGVFVLKDVPFYATIHTTQLHYTSKQFSYKFFRKLEVFIYKFFDFKIIAISDAVKMMCLNILKLKNIELINNGIDTNYYKKINSEKNDKFFKLITIGRYAEAKGHIYLLEALSILVKNYKINNIKLFFVGRELEKNLFEKVTELNLEDHVCFLGEQYDIPNQIAKVDIGIFPSIFEGFPLACGEMMSCGLPCVVSDIDPLIELTLNGEGALLTKVKSPESIAEGIFFLIKNNDFTFKLGNKARDIIIENFSIQRQIENHSKLYGKQ